MLQNNTHTRFFFLELSGCIIERDPHVDDEDEDPFMSDSYRSGKYILLVATIYIYPDIFVSIYIYIEREREREREREEEEGAYGRVQ